LVALHLSIEVGHLEEEVRTSVEEIALLRCELEDVSHMLALRITTLESIASAAPATVGDFAALTKYPADSAVRG
jgi:hypothetical protein